MELGFWGFAAALFIALVTIVAVVSYQIDKIDKQVSKDLEDI